MLGYSIALRSAATGQPRRAALGARCSRVRWSGAVFTKPQAVVLAPAIAVAIWHGGDRRRAVERAAAATAAAAVVAALAVAPVVAAGAWANMVNAFSRLAAHDMMSANACNLWWIVDYLVRAKEAWHDQGFWRR